MKLRILGLLSIVVLLGIGALAVACGGGDEEDGGENPEAAQPTGSGEGEFEVKQDDFDFEPDELQGSAGAPVKVELGNEGNVAHTFTIDELGVDQVLQPGEKATVEFTPGEGGTLAFYCRFHRSQGMEGELTVSGSGTPNAPSRGGATDDESSGGFDTSY